jgi:hypothetical protein
MDKKLFQSEASVLQQIRGIGPSVATRLAEAGIDRLEALATATPEQVEAALAGLPVISPGRIREWIAAAGALAPPPSPKAVKVENGQYYATFKLELLLGRDDAVRRTRIGHVQSDRRETWAGWNIGRVDEFVMATVGKTPLDEAWPDEEADEPEMAEEALEPVRLHDLTIVTADEGGSPVLVRHNEPFDVRFGVAMGGVRDRRPARLTTTIYARPLGQSERRQLFRNVATRPVREELEMAIGATAGAELTPGAYRLEVEVDVEAGERRWPTASLCEGMMLVY